jgi:hypothetical protein
MPRLYLFAEGSTELAFADTVLRPHLEKLDVYLQGPILIAHSKKRGKVHRGGGRRYLPMKNDIIRFLKQEKNPDVFFTTMIDLYAIHADFPGLVDAEKVRHLPFDRVELLERAFASDIGDARFIPYIQLHEYEAYLFSDPTWFGYFYERHQRQIDALMTVAASKTTPELIDDGLQTAPSKRIIAQFPDYEDAKTAIGPQVAELIGLDIIRAKCPHFAAWVSSLEKLGRPVEG